MPIIKGRSKETIRKNIKELKASGKSQEVAVAIALDTAGRKKKRKPKKPKRRQRR